MTHKHATVIAIAFAGCVVPQNNPPPQYGYPQPQQGYATQQQGYAPQVGAATATCHNTLDCYGQCNPMTEACITACDQRTTPESAQQSHAVLQCMAQSGCADQNCVVQRCGVQITTCTNMTLATASPTASVPMASGDPMMQTMQPEYNSVGSLWIPPPKGLVQQSYLTGEWGNNDSATSVYASSNGSFATFNSVSISQKWVVDGQGKVEEDFAAGFAGQGGAHGFKQHNVGTFTVDGRNVIAMDIPAQNGNKAYTEYFIIVGWFVGPEVILMKLHGPIRSPLTDQEVAAESQTNSYMNHTYVRRR